MLKTLVIHLCLNRASFTIAWSSDKSAQCWGAPTPESLRIIGSNTLPNKQSGVDFRSCSQEAISTAPLTPPGSSRICSSLYHGYGPSEWANCAVLPWLFEAPESVRDDNSGQWLMDEFCVSSKVSRALKSFDLRLEQNLQKEFAVLQEGAASVDELPLCSVNIAGCLSRAGSLFLTVKRLNVFRMFLLIQYWQTLICENWLLLKCGANGWFTVEPLLTYYKRGVKVSDKSNVGLKQLGIYTN